MLEQFTAAALFAGLCHLFGAVLAVHAVMYARTAQGSLAWAISLVSFPYAAVPLYAILGRSRFHGYIKTRRTRDTALGAIAEQLHEDLKPYHTDAAGKDGRIYESLVRMPFTSGNRVDLLVDGEDIVAAMLADIAAAESYVLVQFFIIHDDATGRRLADALLERVRAGVRVLLLYDEIGSHDLPSAWIEPLRAEGIEVRPFHTTRGRRNRFQLNFRNHRKVVLVDGRSVFVGGLNIGEEYMGRSKKFGPWRDTHVRLEGPAVPTVQLVFCEDWNWAGGGIPEGLDWTPRAAERPRDGVLVLPTGPADTMETCGLFFLEMIHRAEHRLWIASPYFVPGPDVMTALKLASLRGVDVRILLPDRPDHLLVYLSAFSYLEETEGFDIHIHRYEPGFLHQKVVLVDHDLAAVGTANLDNRSFRLNFEVTALIADVDFATEVEAMLTRDIGDCHLLHAADLRQRPFWFRLAVRLARLAAPIQ